MPELLLATNFPKKFSSMSPEQSYLMSIAKFPNDWQLRCEYANWLIEDGQEDKGVGLLSWLLRVGRVEPIPEYVDAGGVWQAGLMTSITWTYEGLAWNWIPPNYSDQPVGNFSVFFNDCTPSGNIHKLPFTAKELPYLHYVQIQREVSARALGGSVAYATAKQFLHQEVLKRWKKGVQTEWPNAQVEWYQDIPF